MLLVSGLRALDRNSFSARVVSSFRVSLPLCTACDSVVLEIFLESFFYMFLIVDDRLHAFVRREGRSLTLPN